MGFSLSKAFSVFGSNQIPVTAALSNNPPIHVNAIELEPRILYSASPIDIEILAEHQLNPNWDHDASDDGFVQQENASADLSLLDASEETFRLAFDLESVQLIDSFASLSDSFESTAQQIVFIDTNVEGWEQLFTDLNSVSKINGNISIVLLDANRDGIAQISETLAQHSDVNAIHLISHGNNSQLNVGGTTLTNQNLNDFAYEIAEWGDALVDGADFLIYGCDLASSQSGRDLIDGIGILCDCDVAASENSTGHESLGADWEFEYLTGQIEADVVFSESLQTEWFHRLATFTVTSTLDDGSVGTLRWAIAQANTNGGLDTIEFNIPDSDLGHFYYRDDGTTGSLSLIAPTTLDDSLIADFDPDYPFAAHSWFRIDLNNALPQLTITDALIIDGYSQSGASQNTLAIGHDANLRIELTSSAADGNRGLTYATGSNGSILRGLAINDFDAVGVMVDYDVHNVTIQGNFIGTDITGTVDKGNGDAGIQIRSNDNSVGGPNVADRNIISGSNGRGIAFFTFGTITGNVVENNYIGVDATGLMGLGNRSYGIQLYDTDGTKIINNVIGDSQLEGILFRAGADVHNSIIQGNMIGVGADGTTIVGNGSDGIRIESNFASGNQIGGTGVGEGNVIANNDGSGIVLTGAGVSGTTIVGNFIGTDATGLLNLGNADYGVLIENGSFNNTIGGTTAGSGNTIAFNQKDGVTLKSDSGNGNAILGNSIYDNSGLGIDLNDDGETDNDDFDGDGGANTRINFPVLTAAITDGASAITISGWFNTTPGIATYRLEFFSSPTADPGGNGEGKTFIGTIDVITDANGVAQFSQTFAAMVGFGEVVAATATDGSNNTSEFGLAITAGTNAATTDGIWISTENDVSAGGAPGLSDWTKGEVISFGGPTLELEPVNTVGSFASVVNLDLLGDGDVDIDGIHYVTQAVTLGTGLNSIDLFAGDLLISTGDNESFFGGTFSVDDADLFLYRPITAGDYSVGTMTMVLDMDSPTMSDPDLSFGDMLSVTLVEEDVTLGGYDLFAGEILFTRDGGGDHQDIYVFHVTDVGTTVTDGTADKLIEGSTLGFSQKIIGLDIIERSILVGDETIVEGTLLISLGGDTDILDTDADLFNDLSVTRYDIISLDITQTEMNGGTLAPNATLIFEGADVNIDNSDENIDAFTIVGSSTSNVAATDISPDTVSADELIDTTLGYSVATLTNNDPDAGDTFTYTIVGGADAANFSIGGAGFDELILTDGVLDFETKSTYSVDVEVKDSNGNIFVDTVIVNVNDLNDQPVITSDGGGAVANLNVVENTTAVTTVTATDQDIPPNTLAYNISGGADSLLFAINSSTGALSFISPRDFETRTDANLDGIYEVQVTVTDGNGGSDVQTINVTITDENETPILGANQLTITEGSTVTITAAELSATDVDNPDPSLTFTVSNVIGGQFELISATGVPITSFTQAQVTANLVVFVDDGDETAPSYDVTVSDGGFNDGPQAATITFFNDNDAPVLGANQLTITEGSTVTITAAGLSATDVDNPDPSLTFTVSNVSGGQFELTSAPGVAITSFTQAQVSANQVVFVDDGDEIAPSYDVTVSDGSLTDGPFAAMITFSNINDAPTLLGNGNLAATVQDDFNPPGDTIGNLFFGLTLDVDPVSSLSGIAIIGNPTNPLTEGDWQYSTDSGTTWQSIGNVNDGAMALGLSSTSLVRFVPATGFSGMPTSLEIRAIDDSYSGGFTNGTSRVNVDTTTNGGITPISANSANIDTAITPTIGILVTPTGGSMTSEAGGTANFDVVLLSAPTSAVTIAVASNNTGEGTASTGLLTFTTLNWNQAQTVTVTGVDDFVDDGDIDFKILLGNSVSTDSNYNGIDVDDVSVVNVNDDVAGVLINPVAGLITDESGATASFEVVLSSEPTSLVTLNIASSDSSEGTVSTSILTFDATNWNRVQNISITGVDDFADDGNIAYSIVLGPAISSDPNYDGLDPSDASVTNIDNDSAGVIVSKTYIVTDETGTSDFFDIMLRSQPTTAVMIGVSSSDTSEGTVSTNFLMFDPSNWNIPQTVTVTGQADSVADGDMPYQVALAPAVSADPVYDNLDPADVNATNNDLLVASPIVTTTTVSSEKADEKNDDDDLVGAVINVTKLAAVIPKIEVVSGQFQNDSVAILILADVEEEEETAELLAATTYYYTVDARTKAVDVESIELATSSNSIAKATAPGQLWNDLDLLQDRMQADAAKPGFVVGSIASMASALTVGYVTWLIRGGQILVSVMAHMPAWRLIDPLPILTNLDDDEDDSEEESLASMLDDAENQKTDDPVQHTEEPPLETRTTRSSSLPTLETTQD